MISEFLGTALLVFLGCSFVIVDFGHGSPVVHLLPQAGLRRALTGFLFGSVGASIALSKIGKISGAHINPVVTLAFWLMGKVSRALAWRYMAAQVAGGVLGALPLLLWGPMGQSIRYAATVPGPAGVFAAVGGEIFATFCLVAGLFAFLGHHRLRRFTPFLFPVLYLVLVYLEAPLSGTSTNPARSLGPALVGQVWRDWWVYWIGPGAGSLFAIAALRLAAPLTRWELKVAKLYHFHHDPFGLFPLPDSPRANPTASSP